jgi:hypothetical protein
MWNNATQQKAAGIDVSKADGARVLDRLQKLQGTKTGAEIGQCVLANRLESLGLTFAEASTRTDIPAATLKRYAARAVVIMELPYESAHLAYDWITPLGESEARDLGETIAALPESSRLEYVQEHTARTVVQARVGNAWTTDQKDSATAHVIGRGQVLRKRMADAVVGFAEAHGIELPKRESNPPSDDGTPSTSKIAGMLAKFEQDRVDGSDAEHPFQLSKDETDELAEARRIIDRTLARAGAFDALTACADFTAEVEAAHYERINA